MSHTKYPEGYAENLGANIQDHRERLGLSQIELAKQVNARYPKYNLQSYQISAYELARAVAPVHILEALANVFGKKVDDLLKKNKTSSVRKRPHGDIWEHAEEICRIYVDDELSAYVLADQFNTSYSTIYRILHANNIEIRTD